MTEDPIFLDRTGRRHRLVALLSTAGGLLLVLTTLALVAGFTGTGPGALPGWPAPAATSATARPTPAPRRIRRAAPAPAAPRTSAPAKPATIAPPAATPARVTPSATATPTASPTTSRPGHRPTAKPHNTKKP
jgi:hypothetical protein